MTSTALRTQGTALKIGTGSGGAKTITAVAVGVVTILTSAAHGFNPGDKVTFSAGFTGADAASLNSKAAVVLSKTTNTFAVGIDTTGLTITAGTATATPTTFTTIANLTGVPNIQDGSSPLIDTTNMASTVREFLAALPDDGNVSFALDIDWSDAGTVAVEAKRLSGQLTPFQVVLPSGTTPTFSFNGVITKFSKAAPKDGKFEGTVDVKISGQGSWA
jgi:hypothetical protein